MNADLVQIFADVCLICAISYHLRLFARWFATQILFPSKPYLTPALSKSKKTMPKLLRHLQNKNEGECMLQPLQILPK